MGAKFLDYVVSGNQRLEVTGVGIQGAEKRKEEIGVCMN